MKCSNCNKEYEITEIEIGRSKYCRYCGNLLYTNIDGRINNISTNEEKNEIINNKETIANQLRQEIILKQRELELEKQRIENSERLRQEQLLQQRQLEIEQQKKAEAERLKQEETLRLRQLEIQKKQDEEKEKLRQEQLIRERQLELERERIETERKLKEELERAARELEEQKIKALQEIERLELEKIEKEIRAKILLEQEEERRRKEKEIQAQLEQEEQVRVGNERKEAEKHAQIQTEVRDSDAIEDSVTEVPNKRSTFSKVVLFVLLPALLLSIAAFITLFLVYPENFKSLISKSGSAEITETEKTPTFAPNNTDSLLTEQIKQDLTGKEVLSWGNIQQNDINDLKIVSVDENENNIIYVLEVWLDDKNGTKGIAELNVQYNKIILASLITTKITYQNTAPVNAWFSFAPVADCDIFVNSNGNPILVKGCQNCALININSSSDRPEKLLNYPETIFIQSDTKSEAIVDFIYVPKK